MEPGNRLVEQQTWTVSTFSCLVSEMLASVAWLYHEGKLNRKQGFNMHVIVRLLEEKEKGENLRNWGHFASPEPTFNSKRRTRNPDNITQQSPPITSKAQLFWTALYRGYRKNWPISLCLFSLGTMIFLIRGLQKGRVCTAEASPPPMQLFHRCSKNTCAYQRYTAVGWHRKLSLHPAIRTGASYPILSSA